MTSTNAVSIVKENTGYDNVEGGKQIKAAQEQAKEQNVPYTLKRPDFKTLVAEGATIVHGQGDGVLFIGQAGAHGATPKADIPGYNERIVLGVGLINGKNKEDRKKVDLRKDNMRMAAGIRIDQRTKSGKKPKDDYKNLKDRDRDLTTPTPLDYLSSVQIVGDRVAIAARTAGVDIIGGFDPEMATSEGTGEPNNIGAIGGGVKLINANWDEKILNNEAHPFGLQPIPKGKNLDQSLDSILACIEQINKVLKKMHTANVVSEKATRLALAKHSHIGTAFVPIPVPPFISKAFVITKPDLILGGELVTTQIKKSGSDVLNMLKLLTQRYNSAAARINKSYLSEGYVSSRGNFTT